MKNQKHRVQSTKDPFLFLLSVATVALIIVLVIAAVATVGEKVIDRIEDHVDERSYSIEYMEQVNEASIEFDVPREIVFGIIFVESTFRPEVVSRSGAIGLMQLKPDTFLDMQSRYLREHPDYPVYTVDDLTSPDVNIHYGCSYLAYLYRMFGDWELVYAAYNGGLGNVRFWLADERYSKDGKLVDIPLPETASYVRKVHAAVEKYRDILNSEDNNV